MELNAQILFFLGAIGVFNCLILSVYLIFFTKSMQQSNRFLGLFLLMLCARVIKSIFYYFDTDLFRVYLKTGPIFFVFIGPFLLFYILSIIKPQSGIIRNWKYHISIWAVLMLITHYLYPFKTNVMLWKNYILHIIEFQWLAYIIFSGYMLRDEIQRVFNKNTKHVLLPASLFYLCSSTLILWSIYFFTDYEYFIVGPIFFSFLFYSFFLYAIFNKKKHFLAIKHTHKYADKKIEASKARPLLLQLDTIMQEQKLYRDSSLKSSDVAKQLNIPTHQFSQLLNDNLGKSFAAFINEYRIDEAKTLLITNTKYTLEGIGNECGFNSKSTFYSTFKKLVGTTPAKYRAQN